MLTSYNGWVASRDPSNIGVKPFIVAGRSFPGGVKAGPVSTVLRYCAAQYHLRVESLYAGDTDRDDWGYSYRANVNNPSQLSCHASGTAIDMNAVRHPNGKRHTFTYTQVKHIRQILGEVGGLVRWGGDFSTTADEMHWEVHGTPAQIKLLASHLLNPPWWHRDLYLTGSTVSKWLHGDDVKHLQHRLGFSVDEADGVFGPHTRDAVRRLEGRLLLPVTGKVTKLRAFYVG